MRFAIAAVTAALLVTGTATTSIAVPLPRSAGSAPAIVQGMPPSLTTDATAHKKKKKKKSSSSVSFQEIQKATLGKKDLEIKVKASRKEYTCKLSVKWKDGKTAEDESVVSEDKICEFSVEVPSATKTLGEATARVNVYDTSGRRVGTASKKFTVVK